MALTRDQIQLAALPKEAIQFAPFGGEVIIRAMTLSERLNLFSSSMGDGVARFEHVAKVLGVTVIDPNGLPLLSATEWEEVGGTEMLDVLALFDKVRKLSGLDAEEVEKN